MGNRNQQANSGQSAITVGVHAPLPPDMRPGPRDKLAARVDRREKEIQANRELQAENARLTRQLETERIDRNLEDIGILKVQAGELTRLDALRLGRTLKAKFEKHCAAGLEPRKFDPYRPMNEFMARIGKALPPAPKNGNGLTANLPPPSQAGRVLPQDRAADDAKQREAQERGARLRAEVLRDRQAYQDALKRHGLSDPTVGTPGPGRGLGY